MKDLTVIVPVHEYNNEVEQLLKRAVDSFYETDKDNDSEILFIGSKKVIAKIKEIYSKSPRTKFVENEKTDFSHQINVAVEQCKKYFSILEFDDIYTPNWFKNVKEYSKESEDISIYLPLTEIILSDK